MRQIITACIVAIAANAFAVAAVQTAEQSEGHVYRVGDGVSSPQLIKEVMPKYTAEALRRKIEGQVQIRAVVGIKGTITEAIITKSLDSVKK
jgi:outer membrane biosynthesis protein TonB